MMEFKREPSMVFEDLMNQHIFGNRHIINPTTRYPWDRAQTPFSTISPYRMTTIADLYFTFNQNNYKRDPEVLALIIPDPANANLAFSTHHNRLHVPVRSWNQLYLSIPPEWRAVIHGGNQEFNEGEFFATVLARGDIGDVFRYQNGLLHYYTQRPKTTCQY